MKIFFNALAVYSGGQITRAKEFTTRLEDSKDIKLIVLKEEHSLSELEAIPNFNIINIKCFSFPLRSLKRMLWENFILPKKFFESKADIYLTFSHYLPKGLSRNCVSIVGVSNLAPFSIEAWEFESFFGKIRLSMLKKTILSSCKRANRVLALSETCKSILIEEGIDASKIFVASNGVSDFWSKDTEETIYKNLKPDNSFVLYVSHFYYYKNFKNLVLSFNKLPKDLTKKYSLVLVGRPIDGSCYDEVKSLISELNLEKKVIIFPGLSKEELRFLYKNTELFVFASLIENSPNILLEAMKSGSPVLTSDLEPMPEFCGSSAEYFRGLDVNDLTEKMEMLLRSPEKRDKLSRLSVEKSNEYTWENFNNKLLKELSILKRTKS